MAITRYFCLVILIVALVRTAGADVDTEDAAPGEQAGVEAINAARVALENHDYAAAYETFRSLAGQDDAEAQYQLALLYHRGLGAAMDPAEASRWYRRAAEQDHAEAQYRLGNMYLVGEGVEQDDLEANHWYEKAANQGHVPAKQNLSKLRHISKVKTESELAAEVEAEAALTEVDDELEAPEEAAEKETGKKRGFFKRMFSKDDPPGSDEGGAAPAESDDPEDEMPSPDAPAKEPGPEAVPGAPPFPEQAREPEVAGEEKRGFFSRIFGRDDKPGKAVSAGRDDTQAVSPGQNEPALDALEQSGAVSNYELGMAYALGDGVDQDHVKAFGHFVKSAEQGYAPAQYRVGVARAFGEGTEKDLDKAVEWFTKSALQNYTIAQRNLGMIYLDGGEVEQNKPLALAWFSLLSHGGNQLDIHRRDKLLQELSPVEIQEAKALQAELEEQLGD